MRNYKFTRDWFIQHIPKWEKSLPLHELKGKKINVLEIGVFEGRATIWILEELIKHPESKLTTIDTFEKMFADNNNEATFRGNIKESGKENQVEIIKNNSFKTLTKFNCETREKFDLIYINHGSLTSCDVLSDAVLSWNLLKEGGIMILNNYELDYFEEEYNNPRIAIDSFLRCYQRQLEVIYKHYQVAVRKVIKEIIRTARVDKSLD